MSARHSHGERRRLRRRLIVRLVKWQPFVGEVFPPYMLFQRPDRSVEPCSDPHPSWNNLATNGMPMRVERLCRGNYVVLAPVPATLEQMAVDMRRLK